MKLKVAFLYSHLLSESVNLLFVLLVHIAKTSLYAFFLGFMLSISAMENSILKLEVTVELEEWHLRIYR